MNKEVWMKWNLRVPFILSSLSYESNFYNLLLLLVKLFLKNIKQQTKTNKKAKQDMSLAVTCSEKKDSVSGSFMLQNAQY